MIGDAHMKQIIKIHFPLRNYTTYRLIEEGKNIQRWISMLCVCVCEVNRSSTSS